MKCVGALMSAMLLLLGGCAGNSTPIITPQASIAHYGSTVIDAVTQVQLTVTQGVDAKSIPVDVGKQVTTVNEKISAVAKQLGAALRAYDTATTLQAKKLQASDVQELISKLNGLLSEAFNITIPGTVGGQIAQLLANVAKTVSALSAEIAKGLM